MSFCCEVRGKLTVPQRQDYFVGLYGWHESGGSLFMALQYVEGGDLHNRMKTADVAPSAKEITRQVLTGLATLHDKNICHGDLHPSVSTRISCYPFPVLC